MQCTDDGECAPGYCGGGACVQPELFASGQNYPSSLALTADEVLWTNNTGGEVMRQSKAGSVPAPFVKGQQAPSELLERDGVLFWCNTEGNSIGTAKLDDPPGGVGQKALDIDSPRRLATDGVTFFIATPDLLLRAPVTGGPISDLVTDVDWYGMLSQTVGIAHHEGMVYFSEYLGGRAARVPVAGGIPDVLAPGPGMLGTIAVDKSGVYWMSVEATGTKLWVSDHAGVGATSVFQGEKVIPFSLPKVVTDDEAIYFSMDPESGGGSALRRKTKVGADVARVLASGQEVIVDIAVDATHLYWISGSSILRIALP
ncbi:hypothetical protein [Polyangium jinanense]|uniref:Virginiamycin B lyase n=1 Tax=Polyangium jinanense TaxID=2829994 RepID=A0A9X4AZT2_9BACT|nr:hypothetical protein [Polyangium jinanense]MDC3958674.1 hypothetical protein [Polyangium jinanense]MDC3988462.1 hypothetical protein [Polyangium jinanense]